MDRTDPCGGDFASIVGKALAWKPNREANLSGIRMSSAAIVGDMRLVWPPEMCLCAWDAHTMELSH